MSLDVKGVENTEDESFIILDSSPGNSMVVKINGTVDNTPLDKAQLEDAMKDLPMEASMAYKAHFQLKDNPSPASLMAASTIITEDSTTDELQKRFGEIIDENVILKETLKQNNDSMKEQFLLIASCQEDMMKTHMLHKEKFDETKELIEKLRQENKKLKQDMANLMEASQTVVNGETGESKSGPSSALEFVTSPEDDTVDKLTAQLELVEKQRRQVITENEKLTWQKESLEHIVDATSRERDDLKEKVRKAELELSKLISDHEVELGELQRANVLLENTVHSLKSNIETAEDKAKSETIINQLNAKVLALQNELKNSQLKILELENFKLDFSKHKSGMNEIMRINKEHLQDLHNRLKDASTTVFQPLRVSLSCDTDTTDGGFASNVKLYDRTLKHLAELLNKLTHGLSDSLVESLGLIVSLQELRLEKTTVDQFRGGLATVKQQIENEQCSALTNIGQVRGTLSIFEGIFKDYKELLNKTMDKQEVRPSSNVEALTSALVARGQELQALEAELSALKMDKEDTELMKAQLDLYRSDFEAERQSREKMASEKDTILTDLRKAQKKNEELLQQLEEVRKLNPNIYKSATTKRPSQATPARQTSAASSNNTATGNMVYTCPKCMRFSCDQYKVMEDHFDFCLDDF